MKDTLIKSLPEKKKKRKRNYKGKPHKRKLKVTNDPRHEILTPK